MKFQLLTCLAVLFALDQSAAFSPRANFAVSTTPTRQSSSLRMSTAQDEVAKLRAAAAAARADAARLEKVRIALCSNRIQYVC
jgi:hypothetical protein